MARASKNNGFGRINGFLSDIVPGNVEVETPNGVRDGTIEGENCWAEHAPRKTLQFGGPTKIWGARSGTGKTLQVK